MTTLATIRDDQKSLLILLLALTFLRGFLYSSLIPPWQAPDEMAHFEYVSLLYQKRYLLQPNDASLPLQVVRSLSP